jgi:cation transport protein ChaC
MANGDPWVFGYGSLMWDPGFDHVEAEPALLHGYHRSHSLLSWQSWGSPERPGLVLALMRGGACRGRAFRAEGTAWNEVLAYLDRRENAYHRRRVSVKLAGRKVSAVTYVADPEHPRFAGKLALEHAARYIHQGIGDKGSSRDYLANTVRHLNDFGIADTHAHELLRLVEALDG